MAQQQIRRSLFTGTLFVALMTDAESCGAPLAERAAEIARLNLYVGLIALPGYLGALALIDRYAFKIIPTHEQAPTHTRYS
jgi:hypothetical protein